ncbi:MAG TPA: hypothetical protein VOB72_01925 [Candidatus Dormibacteraeota bacterium]|nr:hypothetical protein [Candidatus Dormibacteraeota bacterium]
MGDHGLPAIVEAGVAAASWRSRAVSLAAGAAAIRHDGAPAAHAEAIFAQAFAAPGLGDFGRVRPQLALAAFAARQAPASTSSNSSR